MIPINFNKRFNRNTKPKKKVFRYNLTDEQELEVYNYFKANEDNRITTLVKVFGYSKAKIHRILNKYI
jgi:uncharacterized membrane protein